MYSEVHRQADRYSEVGCKRSSNCFYSSLREKQNPLRTPREVAMTNIIEIRRTPTTVAYVHTASVPDNVNTSTPAQTLWRALHGVAMPEDWTVQKGFRAAVPATRQAVVDVQALPGSITVHLARPGDIDAVGPEIFATCRQFFDAIGVADLPDQPSQLSELVPEGAGLQPKPATSRGSRRPAAKRATARPTTKSASASTPSAGKPATATSKGQPTPGPSGADLQARLTADRQRVTGTSRS